jgi:Asp-tRNA(Asn)/Glu-tRNA(Gln) amidotransferase A subunit family amidase
MKPFFAFATMNCPRAVTSLPSLWEQSNHLVMRARLSCKSVAITQQAELAPADLRGVRIGLPRAYYWETLDADVAKIMDTTLDKLRGPALF